MKFFVRKKANPAVPIVSLIDILAILLIFFIATTTFKQRKSLVNVALPTSSQMPSARDPVQRVTLAVTKEETIALNEQPVELSELPAILRDLKASNPEAVLELKADKDVSLGFLVKVWDSASQAGLKAGEIPLRIQLKQGQP